MKMNWLDWVVMILVVVGGLNWGLVGFFKFDLVAKIFGEGAMLSRIVYDLVGVAALYQLAKFFMMGGKKPAMPAAPTQPTM